MSKSNPGSLRNSIELSNGKVLIKVDSEQALNSGKKIKKLKLSNRSPKKGESMVSQKSLSAKNLLNSNTQGPSDLDLKYQASRAYIDSQEYKSGASGFNLNNILSNSGNMIMNLVNNGNKSIDFTKQEVNLSNFEKNKPEVQFSFGHNSDLNNLVEDRP